MIATHKLKTDLVEHGVLPQIHAVQGDCYTRAVEITLLSGGVPWQVPEGVCPVVRYRKPDGTGGTYDTLPDGTQSWEAAGNVLTVLLAPQMLTVPGCVAVQVEMVLEDHTISTFTFQVLVERDPAADVVTSEDYVNWLGWMTGELDKCLGEAKESGEFTGPAPDLQIGTVTTLPAGSQATASIRGTKEAPLLDLGLPRGTEEVDVSLSRSGAAADARVTGLELAAREPATESTEYPECYWRYTAEEPALEWLNPPMIPAVEYRTTMRWNGAAVYTMLVDCGAAANSKVTTVTGVYSTKIIGFTGTCGGTALPAVYGALDADTSAYVMVNRSVADVFIRLFCGATMVGKDTLVQMWYLK